MKITLFLISLFAFTLAMPSVNVSQEVKADESSTTCYLNAYTRAGSGETCQICTTRESTNPCTSTCGSEVCWTAPPAPGESP